MSWKHTISANNNWKHTISPQADYVFTDLIENITDYEILNVAHNQTDIGNLKGDKTRTEEHLIDLYNHTVYFRFKQSAAVSTTTYQVIGLGGAFSNARGMSLYFTNGDLRVYASDGVNNGSGTLVVDADTYILPLDYVDVHIQKDRVNKTIIVGVYNPNNELIGSLVNINIGIWTLNDDDNSTYFHIMSYRASIASLLVTDDLRSLSECQNIDSLVGIDLFYPSIITGIDISGSNLHLSMTNIASGEKTAYIKDNDYIKTYGYVIWKRATAGYNEFHFPLAMDGSEIYPSNLLAVSSSYERIRKVEPNDYHTLYDCKIRFDNSFFDRSDSAIWNADCRASFYYDVNDPYSFHISEINQRIFYEYLNTGYRGMVFVKGWSENYLGIFGGSCEDLSRRYIEQIMLYSVDKKGVANFRILEYTGDSFAVAKEDDGSITYDVDGYPTIGYFQMTKPIFAIRFDDGFITQGVEWMEFLKARGINAYITILTGTGILGNYWYYNATNGLPFSKLAELAAEGWEITSHGVDDIDLTLKSQAEQKEDIIYSIAKLKSLGYDIKHYTPHKYGQTSLYVRHQAMNLCMSCHAGYTTAYEGANPKILILDNLSNMRGDISGDFNLDDPAGVQKIKDEIDVAVADNRLAMIFIHEWSQAKQDGLEEVLDYVDANNMKVTTLSGALINNARYLPKP